MRRRLFRLPRLFRSRSKRRGGVRDSSRVRYSRPCARRLGRDSLRRVRNAGRFRRAVPTFGRVCLRNLPRRRFASNLGRRRARRNRRPFPNRDRPGAPRRSRFPAKRPNRPVPRNPRRLRRVRRPGRNRRDLLRRALYRRRPVLPIQSDARSVRRRLERSDAPLRFDRRPRRRPFPRRRRRPSAES